MRRLFLTSLLLLTVAACTSPQAEEEPLHVPERVSEHVRLDADGFSPRSLRTYVGVPVTLTITRRTASVCSGGIGVPGVESVPRTDLPVGEPVTLSLTPAEPGIVLVECVQDPYTMSLTVSPDPHTGETEGKAAAEEGH